VELERAITAKYAPEREDEPRRRVPLRSRGFTPQEFTDDEDGDDFED